MEGCRGELAEEETEVFAFKIMFHGDGKVGFAGFVGVRTKPAVDFPEVAGAREIGGRFC